MQKASSRRQSLLGPPGSGLIPKYVYNYATTKTVKIHPTFDLHFLCVSSFFPADSECLKHPLLFIFFNSPLPLWTNSHNLSAKVPFFTPFPVAAAFPLNSLTVSGWKTLPGFVTSFLGESTRHLEESIWELCKAGQQKGDRSSCHGVGSRDLRYYP